LHRRDLARQAVERGLVELTLGLGLLDHIVRLMRARPLRVSSARLTSGGSASLRMPTDTIFAVGTRSVILSLTKLMTNSSSLAPATSCSSIATIWPTPWDG
jgi:hypothetical protein